MLRLFRGSRGNKTDQTRQAVQKSRESWVGRLIGLFSSSKLDDQLWDELEEILISADVGVDTSLELIEHLKARVREASYHEPQQAMDALKQELVAILQSVEKGNGIVNQPPEGSPLVILVVGVNGVGKTTSIAKLAHHFVEDGKKVTLAAADTFRAAAIDQLQLWGQRAGVDVIAHQEGGDPGAVVFDALQASRARGSQVLIIDTAGRLHTKSNLMAELQKIGRVLKRLDPTAPHEVVLTLDATTGQNGLAQARQFCQAVQCTSVFLAKLDGTARGGIVIAIAHELGLPIGFIGTGEQLQDMAPFDPQEFVEALLAPMK